MCAWFALFTTFAEIRTVYRWPARRVNVSHRVKVKVQQSVEAHELGRALVAGVQLGDEVVLQRIEAKMLQRDDQGERYDDQHQQRQELEPHVCKKKEKTNRVAAGHEDLTH
uniref:Uncharacterized protein n=1 Tax=Anopheles albimanus TaxID=7167 RepID=A0A182FYL3_ANOAL